MSRRALTSYITAAVLAFGTAPLFAQENPKQEGPKNEQGARPNPGASSQGNSGSRPSGGGGGGGSSSSGSGGGSSSSSTSSGGGSSRAIPGIPRGVEFNEPIARRPERRAEQQRDNSGRRPNPNPAPRGDSSRAGSSGDDQRRVSPGGTSSASSGQASDDRRRAVPTYARPRDGRPVVGTAAERRPLTAGAIGTRSYYYDPYYRYSNYYNRYPYGYYYAGYGLGLGYFYDPFLWGYYAPYGYGYGGMDPYYYGGGGGGGYSRDRYRDMGGLRLKVKPLDGQVYVDGYFVGEVDSFDGVFQKLQIEAGAHRVEIRAPGYETVQFEVMVTPGETVTYKGEMKRIQTP